MVEFSQQINRANAFIFFEHTFIVVVFNFRQRSAQVRKNLVMVRRFKLLPRMKKVIITKKKQNNMQAARPNRSIDDFCVVVAVAKLSSTIDPNYWPGIKKQALLKY